MLTPVLFFVTLLSGVFFTLQVKLNLRIDDMKKLALFAVMLSTLALSACTGIRGYDGSGKVCENASFMGISIIEMVSPCSK